MLTRKKNHAESQSRRVQDGLLGGPDFYGRSDALSLSSRLGVGVCFLEQFPGVF